MNKNTKGILGYLLGAVITIIGIIPFWGTCMDYCSYSGSVNPGFIGLGLSILAFTALAQSKVAAESKGGCSVMLLSVFGPVTFLGFAFASNGWYLIAYFFPALIVGLILFIVGVVLYTTSQK